MTVPRFRDRIKQRREAELLEEAARLLSERNYHDINMDELADIVGISKATLYQHFRSKDELVAQVLLKGMAALTAQITALPLTSPLDRLCAVMRFYLRERYIPGRLLAGFATEIILRVMHTDAAVAEARRANYARLGELVEAAQASGEIDPSFSVMIVVRSIFCLSAALERDPSVSDQASDDREIDSLITFFRRGFAPPRQSAQA